jgi:hypothetical protein
MTNVIRACSKAPHPTWTTRSAAANKGKKTAEGTMMWPLEAKPNPLAAADLPEAQTLTPATSKQDLHILTTTDGVANHSDLRCALRHATAESAVNTDIELISLCATALHAAVRRGFRRFHCA